VCTVLQKKKKITGKRGILFHQQSFTKFRHNEAINTRKFRYLQDSCAAEMSVSCLPFGAVLEIMSLVLLVDCAVLLVISSPHDTLEKEEESRKLKSVQAPVEQAGRVLRELG
jgi:hypothetical protein